MFRLKISVLTLCLFLSGLSLTPLSAQTSAVYQVGNVAVDETAESATEARKKAIASGQRLAFERLMTRLVPDSEREKLPPVDAATLESLISGFEIKSEKNSTVRYIATLSFRFSSAAVRRFLRSANAGFSETASKPLLVLPVLRQDATLTLWEVDNPWRAAWQAQPVADGLVPFILPGAEPANAGIISAEQAMNGDQDRIDAITRKYGATDALLAVATLRTDSASGDNILELVVSRFGSAVTDRTEVSSFRGPAAAPPETLMKQAAEQTIRKISEEWKINNQIRFDNRQTLDARISLSGLPDWIAIRSRLNKVAAVDRVELRQLSRGEAWVRLHYFGDNQQLMLGMSQQNLVLAQGSVDWEISASTRSTRP